MNERDYLATSRHVQILFQARTFFALYLPFIDPEKKCKFIDEKGRLDRRKTGALHMSSSAVFETWCISPIFNCAEPIAKRLNKKYVVFRF